MSKDITKPSNKRGDAFPTEGFGLEVDGKIKSLHTSLEAALKAGLELKQNYPVIQIKVFDAVARTRTPVELPKEAATT